MELEELQKEVLSAQLENQPRRDSERYIVGDSDTVTAGTSLTVTFTVDTHKYAVRLHKFYCDTISGRSYTWVINGQSISLNEGEYPWGKSLHGAVVLVIENPTGTDGDVGYFIEGWGDAK